MDWVASLQRFEDPVAWVAIFSGNTIPRGLEGCWSTGNKTPRGLSFLIFRESNPLVAWVLSLKAITLKVVFYFHKI